MNFRSLVMREMKVHSTTLSTRSPRHEYAHHFNVSNILCFHSMAVPSMCRAITIKLMHLSLQQDLQWQDLSSWHHCATSKMPSPQVTIYTLFEYV